ncbi:MAG: TAT-variant-translocated molybdopterin oxidoreductase, partial [Limisphaerales bacterium]
TLTGASADHRLRVAASNAGQIANSVLDYVGFYLGGTKEKDLKDHLTPGIDPKWISECAKDLVAAGKNALVVVGQRQPIEVHLIAHIINYMLGAVGNTVTLIPAAENSGADLDDLNGHSVDTLVILGGNPDYNRSNLNSFTKPNMVVRLGYYEDETSEKANWNFPAAHYLESWGDAKTSDGTLVSIQPLIQPLFGGLNELEFLARIAFGKETSDYEIVIDTFHLPFGSDNSDDKPHAWESWQKFLFNGFWPNITGNSGTDNWTFRGTPPEIKTASAPSAQNLEVIFYRDAKVDDGRYANNGWMQELPDPITKITWDNAVLVSRKTARELGVQNGDVVEISLNGKKVSGPIWTQPGMADYSLGLALGYGRERAGRIGDGVGFNAYKIFSGKYIETGATIKKTGETYLIATTQTHWSM